MDQDIFSATPVFCEYSSNAKTVANPGSLLRRSRRWLYSILIPASRIMFCQCTFSLCPEYNATGLVWHAPGDERGRTRSDGRRDLPWISICARENKIDGEIS
jgi:hypothetical protein